MYEPPSNTPAKQLLLDELHELYDELANIQVPDSIPVLEDIISVPKDSLSADEHDQLQQVELLVQQVVQEFIPRISQEVSRRLRQQLLAQKHGHDPTDNP